MANDTQWMEGPKVNWFIQTQCIEHEYIDTVLTTYSSDAQTTSATQVVGKQCWKCGKIFPISDTEK